MYEMRLLDALSHSMQECRLDETVIVARQHIIEHTRMMFQLLFRHGLRPQSVHLLGKCYSTCNSVMDGMQSDGVNIHSGSTDYNPHEAYDQTTQRHAEQLAEIVAEKSQEHSNVIVLDSGGQLLKAANNHTGVKHESIIGIEQTSSGFNGLSGEYLQFPILNIARSGPKLEIEAPWIIDSCRLPLLRFLTDDQRPRELKNLQRTIRNPDWIIQSRKARAIAVTDKDRGEYESWKRSNPHGTLNALIIGKGVIGAQAKEKFLQNAKTFDIKCINPEAPDISALIEHANVILGCTGSTSLPHHLHKHLKDRTILASLSSSDREFDAVHLRSTLPESTQTHEHSCVQIPGTSKKVYLLNQGFPVNFTGSDVVVPLERIQLTAALLMSAVLESHKFSKKKGFIDYPDYLHPVIKGFIQK